MTCVSELNKKNWPGLKVRTGVTAPLTHMPNQRQSLPRQSEEGRRRPAGSLTWGYQAEDLNT